MYLHETRINRGQINTLTRHVLTALKAIKAQNPDFNHNYPGLITKLRNHLSDVLTNVGTSYPAQTNEQPGRPSADRLMPDSDQVGSYPRFTIGTTGLIDTIEDYFVSRDTAQGEPAVDTGDFHRAIIAIQTTTRQTSINGIQYRANYVQLNPQTGTPAARTATESHKIGIALIDSQYRLDDLPGLSGNVTITPAISRPALCLGIWSGTAYVSRITLDQYREPIDVLLPITKASQMTIGIGWFP